MNAEGGEEMKIDASRAAALSSAVKAVQQKISGAAGGRQVTFPHPCLQPQAIVYGVMELMVCRLG